MNKYHLIGLFALGLLVAALPLYALAEPVRLERAQARLSQQYIADGALMYVDNCATCHGAGGEGTGAVPALNRPALASADTALLYRTIAHAPHGSTMAAWHIDEGGNLNDYQVQGLVTLIRSADWSTVKALAAEMEIEPISPLPGEIQIALMEPGAEEDPHECRSCHEEPEVHADRFGLNCSRCHTLEAWKPALLTRHTFALDHGGEGQVACQTCHVSTYSAHTCYECHEHQPEEMQVVHEQEGIVDFETCIECHPTGAAGEAGRLGYGSGSAALPLEPDAVHAAAEPDILQALLIEADTLQTLSVGSEAGQAAGAQAAPVELLSSELEQAPGVAAGAQHRESPAQAPKNAKGSH